MFFGRVSALLAALAATPAFAATQVPGFQQIHSFGTGRDGAYPTGSLVRSGEAFFGTTQQGGSAGQGTLFRIDAKTLTERVLFSFNGQSQGGLPSSSVTAIAGKLYGTTESGGTAGRGTIYEFNPATGEETVLYNFQDGTDGGLPLGGLAAGNGFLYGTASDGGSAGYGTLFAFNLQTGAKATLYDFKGGSDGATPYATPLLVGGTLYGTTLSGGTAPTGFGTVFAVNTATGAETVLHAFNPGANNDGALPQCALVYAAGRLYGTAPEGGAQGYGVVFAVNPATNAESVVYSFKGGTHDGGTPFTGLIAAPDGRLYGTTQGGLYQDGSHVYATLATVFGLDPQTGTERMLHSFGGGVTGDQAYMDQPQLTLWRGALFGTTRTGFGGCTNSAGCGTAFRLTP